MGKSDLRTWAVKGAEQRLVEIAVEAKAIFAAFPELRAQGRGFDGGDAPGTAARRPAKRTNRPKRIMSLEARKRIGDAQRARWAKQKAAQGGGEATTTTAGGSSPKAGGARRSRKKR